MRVARWALLLEEFQYTIEHRSDKNMVHMVDVLSRSPLPHCLVINECSDGLLARLRKAQAEDSDLKRIFDAIERGESSNCTVQGGVLYQEADGDVHVVVPRVMRRQIIKRAYEQGHFEIIKTEALLKRNY